MSTEVGSLQANLTLDLSNFRAGMSEAANLAAQLGGQLQNALNGNTGFDAMTREVMELVAQINNLSGAMTSLQAVMNTMSSADLFAQMRTHTAALPTEVAAITSALTAANTAASQLASTFANVHSNITNTASAAAGLNVGSFAAEASSINFTQPLNQLTQMQAAMSQLLTQIQQFNTVDMSTGEIMGSGDQMPAFYNLHSIMEQIEQALNNCVGLLRQCASGASDWAQQMERVQGNAERIATSLSGASASMRGMRSGAKGASSETSKFTNQTGRAEKNLQTANGHAVSVKGILGGIVISQAFYSLLNIMEQLVHGAIEFSQNMQDASVAFEYLMAGSDTSSGAFLNAMKDIALQSPLDTTDLTASARKLMAMGFSAEATVPALSILTDTAAVFSNSAGDMADMIDHISLAFGQMLASGKVSAQELRQLYNAGLPIYDLLSEGLGISKEMAKNIGHYNVDSATAVYAVLDQLQKRYGGAAEDMAETMSGSIEVIRESLQQLMSYGWADIFEDLTSKVNKVADYMQALVKITQAYGPGGLFQAIFPESTWSTLRQLISGFQQLWTVVKQLGAILKTAFGGGLEIIVGIGAQVIPVVANIANTILYLVRAAMQASPWLRALLSIIGALVIASFVAKGVILLGKAIYLLTGAKAAVTAISGLIKALATLTGLSSSAIGAILAVAAALLAVVASSEKARAALASFFGSIGAKVNDFAQSLDFGADFNDILMPEFELPDTSDFSGGLGDLTEGMEDLEEATDEAGKSAKKNLQSFDEVFTITPDTDTSSLGALEGLMDSLGDIGNLDYSDLFDWTGDWSSDWGNLSAGLGDLGDLTTSVFDSMGDFATTMWESMAEALEDNPTASGGLIGTAIGTVLGALVGHPKIGAAIGLLVGTIAGDFWGQLKERFGVSDGAEDRIFGETTFTAIGTGLLTAFKKMIESVFGKGAVQGIDDVWAGITLAFSKEGIKALGKASTWTALGSALKSGLKAGLVGALAGIAMDFLTTWLIGAVGEAVGKSEAEISRAEEWGSWGGSILGVIGSIVGSIIAPGIGTLIGGLLGQLVGSLGGGALGLWWDDIVNWWSGVWDSVCNFFGETVPNFFIGIGDTIGSAFASAWDGVSTFFTETLPNWFSGAWEGISSFFTETIPNFFSGIGDTISNAFATAWNGVKTFFTETIPGWWNNFLTGLTTFFTETIPNALYNAGFAIGQALGSIANTVINFFTVTIPNAWNSFMEALTTFFTVTIPNAWNSFVSALGTFFTVTIPNLWNSFTTALGNFFSGIADAVVNFFTVTIPNAWNNFVSALSNFFTVTIPTLWNNFTTTLGNFFGKIADAVVTFFTQTIPNAWNSFTNALRNFFTVTIPNLWNSFTTALGNFFTRIGNSIKNFFTVTIPNMFNQFINWISNIGRRIIDGLLNGLKSGVNAVMDWIGNFGRGIADGFKSVFNIHSPSKLTAWMGEMLMAGMVNGLDDNAKQAIAAATNAATQLSQAIQPETADADLLSGVTASSSGALNALTAWSTTFTNTIATTFETVAAMFDSLTNRLNVATTNMASVPTAINAKMGSLSAVDKIGSANSNTTGTQTVMQVIATLTEDTIAKLSGNIADRLYEYLAPLFATMSGDEQQQAIAYIGTLIADDAGLKELERKLKVIRISEGRRG